MGDHLFSSDLVTGVQGIDGSRETHTLGVDYDWDWRDELEATRVQEELGGRISAIGKQIKKWNGVDSGVFRFNFPLIPHHKRNVHGLIRSHSRVGESRSKTVFR